MFQKKNIGIIGMGVMGKNLALNIESRGYIVVIYNRSAGKMDEIIANNPEKRFIPCYSVREFVFSLEKPRCIFLMITSGIYVDQIIQVLSSYVESGDILIDGGNSFYKDTIRRNIELLQKGIHFFGLGISGGEQGALEGPSLMPGGSKDAYNVIEPILIKIAARADNEPCVGYIGPNGSGHYVKMVHNGIEYGDMQLIAETYFFMSHVLRLTHEQLGKIFSQWNEGELNSYLIDITSHILVKSDEYVNGGYLLDYVADIAENKGTGSWMIQDAINLNIPLNIITESVIARYLSVLKTQRIQASQILCGPSAEKNYNNDDTIFIEKIRKALYLSKIILYAQGFYQLKIGSNEYGWNLDFVQIAKIFRSGCIIRARFLEKIIDIYTKIPGTENLLLAPYCVDIANNYQLMLREIITCGIRNGIPMPSFSAAMSYYDSYRRAVLPTNLIQAQRDCFGAHTYTRVDRQGVFHSQWINA